MSLKWPSIYAPHEGTIYVSTSTHEDDLTNSIVVAFNQSLPRGVDVSFMGDVTLRTAFVSCMKASSIIQDSNPDLSISWKLTRRNVESRKNPNEVNVASFFIMQVVKIPTHH